MSFGSFLVSQRISPFRYAFIYPHNLFAAAKCPSLGHTLYFDNIVTGRILCVYSPSIVIAHYSISPHNGVSSNSGQYSGSIGVVYDRNAPMDSYFSSLSILLFKYIFEEVHVVDLFSLYRPFTRSTAAPRKYYDTPTPFIVYTFFEDHRRQLWDPYLLPQYHQNRQRDMHNDLRSLSSRRR